jgi:putative membrane protein
MARRHRATLGLGLALAAISLLPPLIAAVDRRLTLHMLQEMLLLAIVVPLITYGIGPWASRLRWPAEAPIGILALNAALFGAQLPSVMDVVTRNALVRLWAQALFMVAAFLFWWPILRPRQGTRGFTPIAKIGYLMVASVPPTIPGITLAFSHHLFYPAYRSVEDQQLAGLLLFATAKLALVTGTFVILWRMLTPTSEASDDDEPRFGVPAGPAPAPAWFARLDDVLVTEPARQREPLPLRR